MYKNLFFFYGLKLDIENFQKDFNVIFYNLIWYFSLFGLNYDILLKYNNNYNNFYNKNYNNLKNYIENFFIKENVNNFTI